MEYFDTTYLRNDLKTRTVRSGAITMTSQVSRFCLQLLSTVVLARLLSPHDYGLIAMVTVITGFIEMFKDMGLSTATIQNNEINHSQVSNLFWINVVVSLAFALILAIGAPIISWFYSEPRLTLVTIALAVTFIFSGLTVQHMAILQRQMRFMAVAIIQIAAMGFSSVVGILMAWYGAGYWSLVGMSAALQLGYVIFSWGLCRWRPSLPTRQAGTWTMLKFGGHITGFSIVNYFCRNSDNILLGRFYGANVLGIYSKAYNIMMLPITQISRPLSTVAMPTLSHLQDDAIRYKRYYTKLIAMLAFITMPLMIFLFVYAKEVILLLLGSKWMDAVDIFRVLCINAFIQPVAGTVGLVLISRGQSKKYFNIGVINSIIIVSSFVIGLPWGAIGVSISYTIATYVILVPSLWYCFKQSPISITNFFSAIFQPVMGSIIMGFVIYTMRLYLTDIADIISIVCSLIIGFLSYFLVLIILPGGLKLLREIFLYQSFLFTKNSQG